MDDQGSTAQPPELLKRGRGRPRKYPVPPPGMVSAKRGRGRPRGTPNPAQLPVKPFPETDLGQSAEEVFPNPKRGPGRPPKSSVQLPDGTFQQRGRGRPPRTPTAQPPEFFPQRVWGRGRGRGRGRGPGRPRKTPAEGGDTAKELSRLRAEVREIRDTLINGLVRLEEGVQMVRHDMQRFGQITTATITNGGTDTLTPQVPEEDARGLQEE